MKKYKTLILLICLLVFDLFSASLREIADDSKSPGSARLVSSVSPRGSGNSFNKYKMTYGCKELEIQKFFAFALNLTNIKLYFINIIIAV